MKAFENHGKQLVESHEITKKDFNIERDSIPQKGQKVYIMNLLEKRLLSFII